MNILKALKSILSNLTTYFDTAVSTVDGRVALIKTNTDNLDTALSTLDGRLANIKTNTDNLDTSLSTLDGRLASIKTNSDNLDVALSTIKTAIDTINTNVAAVKGKTDGINFTGSDLNVVDSASSSGGATFDQLYNDQSATVATKSYTVPANKQFKLNGIIVDNFANSPTNIQLKLGDGTTVILVDERAVGARTQIGWNDKLRDDRENQAQTILTGALADSVFQAGKKIQVDITGGGTQTGDIRFMGELFDV